jgi:hypothetical protein
VRVLKLIPCIALLWVSTAATLAAAPFDRQMAPAGAKWFIHFDIEAMLASRVGGTIATEINKGSSGAGIEALANLTGVNITKDIRDITLYGMTYDDEAGVVVVRGKLDHGKLITLAKTNSSYKEIKSGNVVVHQWTDEPKAAKPGPTQYAAFPKEDVLVLSQDLKQVLALAEGKRDSKAAAGPAIEFSKGAFVAAHFSDLGSQAKSKPDAEVLAKLVSANCEIGESDGKMFASLAITAENDQIATDLRAIGAGLLAFGRLVPLPSEAAAMLRGATVTGEGHAAQIKLNPTVDNVFALLKWLDEQKAEKKNADAKK